MKRQQDSLREKRRILCSCSHCEMYEFDRFRWSDLIPLTMAAVTVFLVVGLAIVCFSEPTHEESIDKKSAVCAIIGEAENQGYQGMLAVAGAIRNRGTLKGVYGVNSPRIKKHLYSKKIFLLAEKAWAVSASLDITNGADHWENISAFGCPQWVKKCVETFRYKDHIFYKEIL